MFQKFYKCANYAMVSNGYQILLDERTIRTPEKQDFIVPTQALALNIASEWQNQDKFILQHRMPLVNSMQMNMSASAIDLPLTLLRPVFIKRLTNFLKNDSAW